MKAIVMESYGSPDVLKVKEVERPVPGDNDILIKVHAVEVTKGDTELRRFQFPVKWFWLPLRLAFGIGKPKKKILGGYFSGVVETVGNKVTRFSPGEEIFGVTNLTLGAYGQYMCQSADKAILPKPKNLTFEEAASTVLGGLNAIHFMEMADIKKGEHVLVNGAGGSIGTYAVQIAKSKGAIITAVDAGHKETMLRSLGVDHFINYEQDDFCRNKETYDVIFTMVAKMKLSRCLEALKPDGRYILANPLLVDMVKAPFVTRFTNKEVRFAFAGERIHELQAIKDLLESETLKPALGRVFGFQQAVEAHRMVESEERLGTVVISLLNETV